MVKVSLHQADITTPKFKHKVRNITTDLTEIKRIIRECYEKLYVGKLNSFNEMDKFLEKQKLNLTKG